MLTGDHPLMCAGGCSAHFLIYIGYDEDCDLWDALEARAEGFIYKSADLSGVAQAMRQVMAGQRVWTDEQLAWVRQWWDEVGSKLATLTEREWKVLALNAEALAVHSALHPLFSTLYVSP